MLRPLRSNSAREQVARPFSIPVPVGGLNAVSPLAAMPAIDALTMTNWFPQAAYIELRRGHEQFATGMSDPVETLISYRGPAGAKLFASAGSSVWEITSGSAVGSALISSTVNARWQYENFATPGGNFVVMVNGAIAPRKYNGTAWSLTTVTATGLTPADLIGITAHKERLWFVEKDSSDVWYLGTEAIAGTASKFPLGSVFEKGGYVMAAGTMSKDAGDGVDDYLCFISSVGEVAIYQGTDPSSINTWALVGKYRIGEPIGRRCFFRFGGDLIAITTDGAISMNKMVDVDRASIEFASVSGKINPLLNAAARDYGSLFGWSGTVYPKGKWVLINVPESANTTQVQYVMNSVTGAWCKFIGMNANCWTVYNDSLYFGGNAGKVYKADTGRTDDGDQINGYLKGAFNYLGGASEQKRITLIRPVIRTNGAVNLSIDVDVDFEDNAFVAQSIVATSSGGTWGSGLWSSSLWGGSGTISKSWKTVGKIGAVFSVRLVAAGKGQMIEINSFDGFTESGGPL